MTAIDAYVFPKFIPITFGSFSLEAGAPAGVPFDIAMAQEAKKKLAEFEFYLTIFWAPRIYLTV